MNTTATREQSAAIRQEMLHIRSRLPYSMDTARDEAKQLVDWKFYVTRFPWASFGAAAAAGYLVAPRRRGARRAEVDTGELERLLRQTRAILEETGRAGPKRPSAKAFVTTALTNVVLRAATAFVGQQIGKVMGVEAAEATQPQSQSPKRARPF